MAPATRASWLSSGPRGVRLALVGAAVAVLLAGGTGAAYLVRNLSAPPRQHGASGPPRPSASPQPSPTPTPTGRAGQYQVAEPRWFTFTETPIKTTGARILHVVVRYPEAGNLAASPAASAAAGADSPAADGPFPLVVFAPGYLQCASAYSDLLTQWASAGYVVAAVNFPRTSCPAYTAKANEKDLVNQPGDVDSVIGYLDAASKAGQGLPAGLIDPSRVAVAGHSDGGDTVAAMAANPCCRNLGLRAVIVLSGAELPGVTGPWFTGAAPPPMLFVQGSADTINKPSFSEQLYQADTAGTRYYLNLLAGAFAPKSDEHLVPYEGSQPPEPIVSQVTIDFLDQYLQGSGNQTSAMQAVGNTGASQLTIDRPLP